MPNESDNSNIVSEMHSSTFAGVKKKPIERASASRSWTSLHPSLTRFMGSNMLISCTCCEYHFKNFEQLLGHFLKCHPTKQNDINVIKAQVLRNIENPPNRRIYKPKSILRKKPKPTSLECDICQKVLKTNSYRKHMRLRHAPDRFKCTDCDSAFSSRKELKSHIKTFHPGIPIIRRKRKIRTSSGISQVRCTYLPSYRTVMLM